LTLQRKETEVVNKKMSVGLGWLIGKKTEQKDDIHFHDGGSGGFTSLFWMNVNSRTAVVILSNISPFHIIKATTLPKLARLLYRNKIDPNSQ
jgi:CubicO group peptidase (beta-lactamase class C family)